MVISCDFFLLVLFLLIDRNHVSDSSIESFLVETGVVLETDGHVGAETGHLEEVDAGLANDFLNVNGNGEGLIDLLHLDNGVALFVELRLNRLLGLTGLSILKHIEGESLVSGEGHVDDVVVLVVRVAEANNLFGFTVKVGLVVVVLLDGLVGSYQLTDVNGGRLGLGLQVVSQVLELVSEVVSRRNVGVELGDSVLVRLFDGLLGEAFFLKGAKVALVVVLVVLNGILSLHL